MHSRLQNLIERYPCLAECAAQIQDAFDLLEKSFRTGGKILLCGNGGSAADADHWAGELLKGFAHQRPLSERDRTGLPQDLADRLQWALPAIPLTGFPAFSTAFSNDVEPELVFAQLVLGLGNAGDVLVALSTSGDSANVCQASIVARARKVGVLALTGKNGGRLKNLADVCIRVPAMETPLIQELHLPIYHCLCLMLEDHFLEHPDCEGIPSSSAHTTFTPQSPL